MKTELILCDKCKRPAHTWLVIAPDRPDIAIETDLCDTHARPLKDIIDTGRIVPLPKARRKEYKIVTLKDSPT